MEQFFYLHDVNFWLSCFGPSFRCNLVTIGVLEFVVVIDVYAQPTREKIKFYRTASERRGSVLAPPRGRHTLKASESHFRSSPNHGPAASARWCSRLRPAV